jgi:hypothetical protein
MIIYVAFTIIVKLDTIIEIKNLAQLALGEGTSREEYFSYACQSLSVSGTRQHISKGRPVLARGRALFLHFR